MWMLSGHCPHYNITLLSECMIEIQCVHTMSLQCTMFTYMSGTITIACPPTHWAASLRWGISFIISTHGRWAVITYTDKGVRGKCANDMMPSYPPKQQDRENELTVYTVHDIMKHDSKGSIGTHILHSSWKEKYQTQRMFFGQMVSIGLTVKSPPSLSSCPEHQGISNWNLNLQPKP